MRNNSSNNKRIAKNTLYMYFRMFFTMCVGLYTSRVVLATLGVEDYGLFNVIGGIIAMFGFLNGAMTNTTSRYITFYLGQGDSKRLTDVFSMAFLIHFAIACIIVLIGETAGLWYFYNKLVVPEGRESAAMWLYQLSIASTVLSILYVPYNAAIVAHEKMSAFAYMSILDVTLKLLIVFALVWAPYDKLVFYGTLIFCIQVLDFFVYFIYCKRKFIETKLHYYWDTSMFKEMFGFAGWSLLGNFSYIFFTQGINLMLNAFCGPAVNAARGIAVQVDGIIKQFAGNVQTAINPQIIKSYAQKELDRMYSLMFASSKFCFYLLLLMSLPIMFEADFILRLWLGNYPDHTVSFLRITLANVILDTMINPMFTANLASGKVKIYQIWVSVVAYSFIGITYLAIRLTNIPESVFLCTVIYSIIGIAVRIRLMQVQIGLKPLNYVKKVIVPIAVVTSFSLLLPTISHMFIPGDILRFFTTCFVCVISLCASVMLFGVTQSERSMIVSKVSSIIKRRRQ